VDGPQALDLAREGIWRTVQDAPSEVVFPGGETMLGMRDRVVAAVREHDDEVRARYGDHAVVLVVSHGDPIKAVASDASGRSTGSSASWSTRLAHRRALRRGPSVRLRSTRSPARSRRTFPPHLSPTRPSAAAPAPTPPFP
jgi:broad specificity phosphatase PhoE